jgi:5'-nucleotidase
MDKEKSETVGNKIEPHQTKPSMAEVAQDTKQAVPVPVLVLESKNAKLPKPSIRNLVTASGAIVIGIDLDGVCADFDRRIFDTTGIDVSKRTAADLPDACAAKAKAAWSKPGFFAQMPLVPDAKQAIAALLANPKYHVVFVTAPLSASEKLAWVKKQFGQRASQRVIITGDKTTVNCTVLIDDRDPAEKGFFVPLWRHIVFDHPSNANLPGPRMRGWKDVDRVLLEALA